MLFNIARFRDAANYSWLVKQVASHHLQQLISFACEEENRTLQFLFLLCRKKKKLNTVARDYILPDYTNVKRGFIRVS